MATKGGKIATMPTAKTALPSCLNVGILWGHGSIASTAAAAVDALRAMNMLAAMRPGGAQPVVRWFWLRVPQERDATPPPVPGADLGPDALDVVVIPGWLVPTGPQLREISQRYSQHFGAMLRGHLQRGGLVAALFNGSSLLAHCGLLAGRKAALPWVFAPSIVLQSSESGAKTADVAEVIWQRERTWQRDGALWTTASLQDTLAAMLDLLAQTPAAELAQAASHALLFDPQRQLTATTAMETPTGHPLAAGALEQALAAGPPQRTLQPAGHGPGRRHQPAHLAALVCPGAWENTAGLPAPAAHGPGPGAAADHLPHGGRCGAAMRPQRHGQFSQGVHPRGGGDARGLPPALQAAHIAQAVAGAAGAAWRRRAGVGRPMAFAVASGCLRQRRRR